MRKNDKKQESFNESLNNLDEEIIMMNLSREELQKRALEELAFNPVEYWKNRFIFIKGKI